MWHQTWKRAGRIPGFQEGIIEVRGNLLSQRKEKVLHRGKSESGIRKEEESVTTEKGRGV